ncbi:MAG: DUF2085 domain-containing protein [Candidatus Thermoplasmatota archaeon]
MTKERKFSISSGKKWLAGLRSLYETRLSIAKLLFSFLCLLWLTLQILAPLTLKQNSANFGESGRVGIRDNEKYYKDFNPIAKFIYCSGDALCHQKASRSLFINGNQLSYCARCTGIFLGIFLGSCIGIFIVVELKWYWILIGLLPMGIDGSGQLFNLWESSNLIRLFTGIAAGLIAGLAVCMILQELTLKRKP